MGASLLLAATMALTAGPFGSGSNGSDRFVACGALEYRDYFGPPNFGENPETDEKRTAAVLLLLQDTVVAIKGEDDNIEDYRISISEIQISVDNPSLFKNRPMCLCATGQVFSRQSGYHITEAVLSATDIDVVVNPAHCATLGLVSAKPKIK